ncbi:S-adenosyl-L-methionine-dependent methyltransferase [Laetiporus sulphureus 93-53]|uniref:S-adenosyl-L-methionine-dependent methyltransferase n=1 Tax=Laetiporus sulphureus 93-53 TaxID=1314785 RepID=A0A165EBF2_9APHY|nr:S-adenosyl-L-methionine-dependent methyltransferase [Laetiporus sulphureus 93-53]KZT06657.1 S-adenosyl-L-methionine-dependent methyltransferase [Laetiporus sulphureus 93-53]
MGRSTKSQQLRSLIRMLADASEVIIKEWESEDFSSSDLPTAPLPSPELFEARRVMVGALGMCLDLVQEPAVRLTDISCAHFTARALHVAAYARVSDILADADPVEGMSVKVISQKTGIGEQKLTRVLRTLCSIHIFSEVKDDHFANNRASQCLVKNEYLRAWILLHGLEVYTASDKLLPLLLDSVKSKSTSARVTAFADGIGTDQTAWEYLEEEVKGPDGVLAPRPSLELWSLAMVGGGHTFASGIYNDYPWEALGSSTIVDVGGGAGGTSLDLSKMFPSLHFVVEDLSKTIQKAEGVWGRENPEAIKSGRVKLLPSDFFEEQPVKGAEVYLLRHVLHDWPDDECVTILANQRAAMGPGSIILVAEHAINTTVGSPRLKRAPPPLPPNYGYAHQWGNVHDLVMMAVHNGMERTPEMLDSLAKRAGLKVTRMWECRGVIAIAELHIDEYSPE